MVRGTSTMGMSAAPFVKAGTGEDPTNEQIGGADVQACNGIADLAADDEHEALDAVRAYLSYLPSSADEISPSAAARVGFDADALIPDSPRRAYDVRRHRSDLDADSCSRSGCRGTNIVTCFARLGGRAVGAVANQPAHLVAPSTAAPARAAHFIAVCDAFGLPLVIMIDLPGFLIGTAAESAQLGRRSGRPHVRTRPGHRAALCDRDAQGLRRGLCRDGRRPRSIDADPSSPG